MIPLKTKEQIEIMDEANYIVHKVLNEIEFHISSGITTQELDNLAEITVLKYNAKPAFKGYRGFPSSLCISINEEVVHGIPSSRIIKNGDIVSIDFGAIYKGFVGDAARTIIVGDAKNINDIKLINETKRALENGIEQMVVGNCLYDISRAINEVAVLNKFGNVLDFTGHGVGANLHEEPKVFNYVNLQETNTHLQEGMVLAIEPMFTLGSSDTKILNDEWTVITFDGTSAAHWELSIAITKNGPRVLGKDDERDSN